MLSTTVRLSAALVFARQSLTLPQKRATMLAATFAGAGGAFELSARQFAEFYGLSMSQSHRVLASLATKAPELLMGGPPAPWFDAVAWDGSVLKGQFGPVAWAGLSPVQPAPYAEYALADLVSAKHLATWRLAELAALPREGDATELSRQQIVDLVEATVAEARRISSMVACRVAPAFAELTQLTAGRLSPTLTITQRTGRRDYVAAVKISWGGADGTAAEIARITAELAEIDAAMHLDAAEARAEALVAETSCTMRAAIQQVRAERNALELRALPLKWRLAELRAASATA